MCKVNFINMPFGALDLPSLALTQLKSMVDSQFDGQVAADIHYLNLEFGRYLGTELYGFLADSGEANNIGLGDWLFRQEAFPELPDNREQYLGRYFYRRDQETLKLKSQLEQAREGIGEFLDDLVEKYCLDEAEITGFTSMFAQNVACFALARKIKELNPEMIVVMGGANCEAPMGPEIVKHVDAVDFVFSGPGLQSFTEFLGGYLAQDFDELHEKAGIFSKRNSVPGQPSPVVPLGKELPIDVPVPLNYDSYLDAHEEKFPNRESKPSILFETSRGCWWGERMHCTFCGLNGASMNFREMSPEQAREQFHELFRYAPRIESLECVDNIMPRSYPKEVFSTLEVPPDLSIFYEVKANLSEEDVEILSRAKVKAIQPGIESLNTSTLRIMRKGATAFTNVRLLKNCALYDVRPVWNLLVGFPREEPVVYEKYTEDMPLLYHLFPPTGVFQIRFDRFSPYFNEADDHGLDLEPFEFYEMVYPFGKESIKNLAYYFKDQNTTADYFVNVGDWMSRMRKGYEQWNVRWNREDGGLAPKLFFKENGSSSKIYDSRSGKATEYDVGEVGKAALTAMTAKPKRPAELAAALGDIADFDPDQTLYSLKRRRLVFQEGERFMSLVLPKEPEESSATQNV